MTNEERRRASGSAMEASRRAIGDAMASSRRAGGDAMTERRTGKSVADDVNALVNPPRQSKPLPRVDPVGALPARVGTGNYTPPPAGGGTGGGIASPLVEQTKVVEGKTVPDRAYYSAGMRSSDGLFVLPAIQTLQLTDANGEPVQIQLANPEGTT